MSGGWAGSDRRDRLPANWPAITRAVKARDRYRCRGCGGARCGNRRLEVDHIVPGDDHRMSNLQTLGASPCHAEKSSAEGNAAKATRKRTEEAHPGAIPPGLSR